VLQLKFPMLLGRTKVVTNWVFAPCTQALNPILIKFGIWGGPWTCFLNLGFRTIRQQILELWGQTSPIPLTRLKPKLHYFHLLGFAKNQSNGVWALSLSYTYNSLLVEHVVIYRMST